MIRSIATTKCLPETEMENRYHGLRATTRIDSAELRSWFLLVCTITLTLTLLAFQSHLPYSKILSDYYHANTDNNPRDLEGVLKRAAMNDNTVIVTTINNAWAEPNSTFDILLESFRIGNETEKLLKHLVVICWHPNAYDRCLKIHPHCYNPEFPGMNYTDEALFMTPNYKILVWKKMEILRDIVSLGFSFVFTDADVIWFRDPFSHFEKDADIQIACDVYNGNKSDRLGNGPNTGFQYVKSNTKTIDFYNFWYYSRLTFPGLHDQDVLFKIKSDPSIDNAGLQMLFLDMDYMGSFCQGTLDLTTVCTIHANCCVGLDKKNHDLRTMLDDWRNYTKLLKSPTTNDMSKGYRSSIPHLCRPDL